MIDDKSPPALGTVARSALVAQAMALRVGILALPVRAPDGTPRVILAKGCAVMECTPDALGAALAEMRALPEASGSQR